MMRRLALPLCILGVLVGTVLLLSGCSGLAKGVSKFWVRITSPADGAEVLAGSSLDFSASVKGGYTPYEVDWDFGGATSGSGEQNPGPVTFTTPTISFNFGEATKDETYNVTIREILNTSTLQRFDYSYSVTIFDLEE